VYVSSCGGLVGGDLDPDKLRLTRAAQRVQKAFLNFVVAPTFDLIKDIAPKSHALARRHIAANLDGWAALAATGDRMRVLNDGDAQHPAEIVHASPRESPFHNSNSASWCAPPSIVTGRTADVTMRMSIIAGGAFGSEAW
jgi:hypothetical protein